MMNKLADIFRNPSNTLKNLAKVSGIKLLVLSDKASNQLIKHNAKQALVDIFKESEIAEKKSYISTKEILLKRLVDCNDEIEKIDIKQKLKFINEEMNAHSIYQRAFEIASPLLLEEADSKESIEVDNEESTEDETISDSWIDKFYEYAKLDNEPWRKELLARALAKESEQPGVVTSRALWVIGTLEKKLFEVFQEILNISFETYGVNIIPRGNKDIHNLVVPESSIGKNVELGNLLFMLDDTGLMGDASRTSRTMSKGAFPVEYGDKKYIVESTVNVVINGALPTRLGESIASFCVKTANDTGYNILQEWLDSLSQDSNIKISELT